MIRQSDPQAALKARAAAASVLFNVVSTLAKLVGALLTHSVSLYSEAAHSATDIAASAMAYFAVRAAAVPPDEEHPFGHGKVESLAGFGESLLLIAIMICIAIESTKRLFVGGEIAQLHTGLWIMGILTLGAGLAALIVLRVANSTRSLALQSNGQHLFVDFITSIGVFGALAVTHWTGWQQADAVVGLLLSFWLGANAIRVAHTAVNQLIDRALPPSDLARLSELLASGDGILNYHRLMTRLAGSVRHIDVHIVVPNELSVVEAHRVADDVEKLIMKELSPAEVTIHVDPFDAAQPEPD